MMLREAWSELVRLDVHHKSDFVDTKNASVMPVWACVSVRKVGLKWVCVLGRLTEVRI